MQIDTAFESRRLAEEYRARTDGELLELAADFADLTEPAQQALRQEMQIRRLGDPTAPRAASEVQQSHSIARKNFDLLAGPLANSYVVPSDPAEHDDQEDDSPRDYTWKTLLCECSEVTEAQQLSDALARAGIESWIEALPHYSIGIGNPRVLVAADQLDRAREIAARPIPQQLIDDSKDEVPDFTAPVCPKCGASDPVLESVNPSNSWQCEQCGAQWTDPAEVVEGKAVKSGEQPS
jgi:hypothetical protein